MSEAEALDDDPEYLAMRKVHEALRPLDEEARNRVLAYVGQRLGLHSALAEESRRPRDPPVHREDDEEPRRVEEASTDADSLDGISPVAIKWMKRTGIEQAALARVFSLDLDEIDLVATKVPGKNKRERMHNVFRLSAMAQYLATGAARIAFEDLKEACLHYDAYDESNHAAGLKKLGREISGTKESGYTLTPTGITEATKLIRVMTGESS